MIYCGENPSSGVPPADIVYLYSVLLLILVATSALKANTSTVEDVAACTKVLVRMIRVRYTLRMLFVS